MANNTSFTLWLDSGRTVPFTGTLTISHEADLSDNPYDTVLYLGSNTADRQLQTVSSPGVGDITITPTDRLNDWAVSTAYTSGDLVEPTTPNTYAYRCTTAGTSDGVTEPTWPTGAIGDTVVDGTVVWTLIGKRHEVTEVTLGATAPDLGTNTPGDPLTIGTTILSETSTEIHIRLINAVTTVQDNTGQAQLSLHINPCKETEVV